ncbi:MAG: hypothetical protein KBC21_02645 [Candidatus Pacebacteria bacterium]|nr:hypothetical protein [Candidatus Paceibacterota bacterium]
MKTFVDFKLPRISEHHFRDQGQVGNALAQRFASVLGPLHCNKVAAVNHVTKKGLDAFLMRTDEARPQFELILPGSCEDQEPMSWRLVATHDTRWKPDLLKEELEQLVRSVLYWL